LTDAQGNVVARYEYDTWGKLLSKSGEMAAENPYRYAGYQYDEETGLYYLIARYYHPTHGVFLSMDPDPGDSDDILTQNGYTYANNNPVMLVDPDGQKPFKTFYQAILGAAMYVVVSIAKSGKITRTIVRKVVKKLSRKGTGKASKYVDVTESGSRYANRATDVSKAQFEKNLLRDGWKKSISKDGKTIILTKDGAKYVLRDGAKSTGGSTADFYPKGSKRMTLKIRLK
ncbi:RHS repeat-associated core domain-containing protein, partial [Thermaerobacillus caldiproteolyticus]|uniref:RHS repeat-associated core domain-containing protein n=1 Tax=Thermaerobacillus caldiproteolyticus TaxID=247480 RepID=UPI0027BB0617